MEKYFGRLLLKKEFDKLVKSHRKENKTTDFIKLPSMSELSATKIQCNRCGSLHQKSEVLLPVGSYYCPTCLPLGRVRSDEALYSLPQQAFPARTFLQWSGTLTPAQQKISDELVKKVNAREKVLVQAVTGAGKTEMVYQAIHEVLKTGGAVCLASPRIDVCLELYKRLSRNFSCAISLLHGGSPTYFRTPLVIATTHQLLHFRAAFDLLIIDEVDAFPFLDNKMLYQTVEKARKQLAALIYLTATSTEQLESQVRSGSLTKLVLAQRFHGNPLTVPTFFWHNQFLKQFKKQRQSNFPLLIFAPEIEFGRQFTRDLQQKFPNEKIAFVASTTEKRLENVENFRIGKTAILVSTTILERGVTFPKVDVFILRAAHPNFTKSSLIQMAGRVGRAPERPTGCVFLFHDGKTSAMVQAKKEIIKLNQKGKNT